MADVAAWNKKQPRIRATADGGIAQILPCAEASGQSYKAGYLVYLDATNGLVTECTDSTALIAGIAQVSASGTASTVAPVQIIKPGDEVIFTCYGTTAVAEVAANTFKQGFTYDLEEINGVCYAEIDSEHATTEELIFLRPIYDVNGDSTNQGVFQVEAVALNFGSAG